MILNLRAYWNTQRVQPFMNETIPVLGIEDDNLTLANFIRREIVTHRASIEYNETDLNTQRNATSNILSMQQR